jgi:hypothetical protein
MYSGESTGQKEDEQSTFKKPSRSPRHSPGSSPPNSSPITPSEENSEESGKQLKRKLTQKNKQADSQATEISLLQQKISELQVDSDNKDARILELQRVSKKEKKEHNSERFEWDDVRTFLESKVQSIHNSLTQK